MQIKMVNTDHIVESDKFKNRIQGNAKSLMFRLISFT